MYSSILGPKGNNKNAPSPHSLGPPKGAELLPLRTTISPLYRLRNGGSDLFEVGTCLKLLNCGR